VSGLRGQLLKVRECIAGHGPCATVADEGSGEAALPAALTEERLRRFLDDAAPRLEAVEQLSKEFNDATATLRRWFAESGETGFREMMRCLASLHQALPAPPKTAAMAALPKRSAVRHTGQQATTRQRARSAPAAAVASSSSAFASRVRCSSAPPRQSFTESSEKQRSVAPAADLRPERSARLSTPRAKTDQTSRQCVVTQPSQPHSGKKLRPLPSPREVSDVRRQSEHTAGPAPVILLEGILPEGRQKTEIVAQGAPSSLQAKPCPPPTEPSREDKSKAETVAQESKPCRTPKEQSPSKLAPLPSAKLAPLPSLPLKQGPPEKTVTPVSAPSSSLLDSSRKTLLDLRRRLAEKSEANTPKLSVTLPLAFSDALLSNNADKKCPENISQAQLDCSTASPVQVALPLEFGAREVPMQGADEVPPAASCQSVADAGTCGGSAAPHAVKQVSLPLEFSMPHLRATPC